MVIFLFIFSYSLYCTLFKSVSFKYDAFGDCWTSTERQYFCYFFCSVVWNFSNTVKYQGVKNSTLVTRLCCFMPPSPTQGYQMGIGVPDGDGVPDRKWSTRKVIGYQIENTPLPQLAPAPIRSHLLPYLVPTIICPTAPPPPSGPASICPDPNLAPAPVWPHPNPPI